MLQIAGRFPVKAQCLFERKRYKVLYGGRGGAKSWSIARALLILGTQNKLRILCAREIQNSIAESVHQLLVDQIRELGLGQFYDVAKTEIRGRNGTLITYAGLRHNIDNIRSKEGIDIVWVEEAHMVSAGTWKKLIPTIRKDGSEIWVSFNPELNTDATYRRFIASPSGRAEVVKINWRDNPWFPAELRAEMEEDRKRNYDDYLHIWEGHCTQTIEGAVYKDEIRAAMEEERIGRVPYQRGHPVHTFWDLGRSDLTAIWFAQLIAGETRLIDYYENCGKLTDHYLKVLQNKPYVYGVTWLPHDAREWRMMAQQNIREQVAAVMKDVRIVPKIGKTNGINAVRTIFPNCWFDESECADGLDALRHYRYKVSETDGRRTREPHHDWASNGADAFRYLAVALKQPEEEPEQPSMPPDLPEADNAWMGM